MNGPGFFRTTIRFPSPIGTNRFAAEGSAARLPSGVHDWALNSDSSASLRKCYPVSGPLEYPPPRSCSDMYHDSGAGADIFP